MMPIEEANDIIVNQRSATKNEVLFALGTIMESQRPLVGYDPRLFLTYLDWGGSWSSFAARCLYLLTARDGITTQAAPEGIEFITDRSSWEDYLTKKGL